MEARWPRLSHDRDILEYPLCGQEISCPPGTLMEGRADPQARETFLAIEFSVGKTGLGCSAHFSGAGRMRRRGRPPAGPIGRGPSPAPADPRDGLAYRDERSVPWSRSGATVAAVRRFPIAIIALGPSPVPASRT